MKAPLSQMTKDILADKDKAKKLMMQALLGARGMNVEPIEYKGKKYVLKRMDIDRL